MKNYKIDIREQGVFINSEKINEEIFNQEKIDYSVHEREQQIDYLIDWISEARDRPNDLYLMKEDLKYLINCKDEFIFSNISTNEYILKEDNKERFNEICEEILELNKELRK